MPKRDNHNPTNRCWSCGVVIPNPKYWVSERLLDYGVHSGDYQSNPIHKTCYEKLEPSVKRFFINGLES